MARFAHEHLRNVSAAQQARQDILLRKLSPEQRFSQGRTAAFAVVER
jgi:hypothetical protein